MQVDKTPFPVQTLELNNPKVLLRPEQAEGAKGKNVVIGDPRSMNANDKILAREVVADKTSNGKLTLRVIVNAPKPRGKKSFPVSLLSRCDRSDRCHQPVSPVQPVRLGPAIGQTGPESSPGPSSQSDGGKDPGSPNTATPLL